MRTPVAGSRTSRLLAPAVWLSGRLSFSRKYLLIGVLVLIGLGSLSVPLWQQLRHDSRLAELQRSGLRAFEMQSGALSLLVDQRDRMVQAQPAAPQDGLAVEHAVRDLLAHARKVGLHEPADRLAEAWAPLAALDDDADAQHRFAVTNGCINALLALIRESARLHRLNVDQDLDATFDMLTVRLPLVFDTLGKQHGVLSLDSEDMASYALGAQVVLSESLSGLRAGIAQLLAHVPHAAHLQGVLDGLAEGILAQQDAADMVLYDGSRLDHLRALASANLRLTEALLKEIAVTTDAHLTGRIADLHRKQWIIAALLVGALSAIAYLFAGIYFSTLGSLTALARGTDDFCAGRLDTRIRIDTQDELVLVARNFNTVATEFGRLLEVIREQNESRERELEAQVQLRTAELADKNEQLQAAGERVQEELMLARNMQRAILPQQFPDEAGWSVHACMYPARELGGDFYDCFALPNGRYGLLVADVSGKGVGAAFFMAVSRTVLLDLAMTAQSPAAVLYKANELLCDRNPMDLFVTACYGIYDIASGQFQYACAGHHAPVLRTADGTVRALACEHDIALAIAPGMDYTEQSVTLRDGDTLLLYTDGVTEAFSPAGEAYGEARLQRWFAGADTAAAAAVVGALVKDVETFVDGAEASDDITCLVLCRKQGIPMESAPPPIELRNKRLLLDYQLSSRLEELEQLARAVDKVLPERPDIAFSANLCLEELITNIIQHGLNNQPNRYIHVRISIADEWLEIILKDDAPPFDPFSEAPRPDLDLEVDDRPIGGLGVHLVKTLMDDARAYYDGSGNLIVLLKTLRQKSE